MSDSCFYSLAKDCKTELMLYTQAVCPFIDKNDYEKCIEIYRTGNYDCVIGISGGKDSTKQALTARDRLGLRCLLVNYEPENITDIGRHNRENLRDLGFDMLTFRPNPKIMKG